MNILITICARGGSKGVKNKNIRPLMGKPLIAYTIEQALRWGRGTDIIVSTDSPDIAAVAKSCGAKIPFLRPAELARDETPKVPVIRHALKECETIFGKQYSLVIDLDPTAPIRKKEDLEKCYEKFLNIWPETLFSVVHAHKNPYFNMVEEDGSGFVQLCKKPKAGVHRRQDAPPVYNMNASIYFYQREFLLNESNSAPLSGRSVVHVMDENSAYDIDREIDFKFLEFLAKEKVIQL